MSTVTLPPLAGANVEYNNYYESKLNQRFGLTDTNCYPQDLPAAAAGFLVLDPAGSAPEHIFYNAKGSNYVSVPSIVAGQGRGVGGTPITDWPAGTTIGIYTIAEYFEGIVTGALMRDGFLQSRHFSSAVNPNSWIGTGESWNYVGNNGQKEYQYLVAGDKTAKYSKGMKVQMPRITAVGTQSALFTAASSQFATKATPAGAWPTAAITWDAWVYVKSYPASGQFGFIIGRNDNSSNGSAIRINSSGQLSAYYGTGGAFTEFFTTQAVPLNQMVHITASMNATAKTMIVTFNHISVPIYAGLTNAAAINQTGNLTIASAHTGAAGTYGDMIVSEARVWSTNLTLSQIQQYGNKQLTGAEANLLGYWKLNGNFNDSAAAANHLTGTNGAVATNTATFANAFSATEYGIITGLSFAAGNTTITIFCGTDCNAPAENLTGISYSGARAPVGFPASETKWIVQYLSYVQYGSTVVGGSWTNISGQMLPVPSGEWEMSYALNPIVATPGSTFMVGFATLSTSPTTDTDRRFKAGTAAENASLTQMGSATARSGIGISNSAMTNYYILSTHNVGGSQNVYIDGGTNSTVITAKCPYV